MPKVRSLILYGFLANFVGFPAVHFLKIGQQYKQSAYHIVIVIFYMKSNYELT